MKTKIFKGLMCSMAIVSLIALSMPAFAEWSNSVTIGNQAIKLSKNVQGAYATGTDTQTYCAATYNKAGTKAFGIASGLTKIKYKPCTNDNCATGAPNDPTTSGDSSGINGWSDM